MTNIQFSPVVDIKILVMVIRDRLTCCSLLEKFAGNIWHHAASISLVWATSLAFTGLDLLMFLSCFCSYSSESCTLGLSSFKTAALYSEKVEPAAGTVKSASLAFLAPPSSRVPSLHQRRQDFAPPSAVSRIERCQCNSS